MSAPPGAFCLRPVFLPKVWAAPALPEGLRAAFPAPEGTGEIWLASDRGHVTRAQGGPLDGLGLNEICARWPEHLLGPGAAAGFPLLAKLLVVGDWLSVQVHPDDEAARRLEGEPWGKSECWRILAAEPGAKIVHGLIPGADRQALSAAVRDGSLTGLLAKVPARAGDTFCLPAGVVHATGPGLTIFELQQASDVTYRFYDWDRPGDDGRPRPLHQQKALEVVHPSGPGRPESPRELSPAPSRCLLLADDPHFTLLEWEASAPCRPPFGGRRLRVFTVLAGSGSLGEQDGPGQDIAAGQTWVWPFGLGAPELRPAAGGLRVMESLAPAA